MGQTSGPSTVGQKKVGHLWCRGLGVISCLFCLPHLLSFVCARIVSSTVRSFVTICITIGFSLSVCIYLYVYVCLSDCLHLCYCMFLFSSLSLSLSVCL